MISFSWNNIRTIDNSQNEGFEELVCQLAKKEFCKNDGVYERYGKPDGGTECVIRFIDGSEYGFQAKYFTKTLTDKQYQEITDSVEKVLDSHPNLIRYYIAFAVDLPNGNVKGKKSCLEKWKSYVESWNNLAKTKNISVEFIKWNASELLSLLSKKENEDLLYFFFNKEIFTDEWFKKKNESVICDLGERYTPENNVDLEIYNYFDAIYRTETFENKIKKELKKLSLELTKIKDDLYPPNHDLVSKIEILLSNLLQKTFTGLYDIRSDIENSLNFLRKETLFLDVDDDRNRKIYDLMRIKERLISLVENISFSIADTPFLLIYGDGGVGKSHLLGEMVSRYMKQGYKSLFFLGQYFYDSDLPWNQILRRLQLRCNTEEFLGSLNAKALQENRRLIIFIDALNESSHNYWKENINSFINTIKKYENLGLVLSVHSEFEPYIFPEHNPGRIIKIKHNGFVFSIEKALPIYFKNYDIKTSVNDFSFCQECTNPLFLKILCETYKGKKLPEGILNENEVFTKYFSYINKKLANKYNYSEQLELVQTYLYALADYAVKNEVNHFKYEDAFDLSKTIVTQKGFSFNLLQELILNNIIRSTVVYTDSKADEVYIFAYEKFGIYCIAKNLIEDETKLYQHINYLFNYKTLASIVFYLYYEKYKTELFFKLNKRQEKLFIKSFILSFHYRKTDVLEKKAESKITCFFKKSENITFLFNEVSKDIINGKISPFILFLHKLLLKMPMKKRDLIFIPYFYNLYYEDPEIPKFINFIIQNDFLWTEKRAIQTAVILSWTLLSTNRKLRDTATKALIKIFQDKIDLLISLLKLFKNVNDPYIYERLYAVVYGCTLRTNQYDKLSSLGLYVYEDIFFKKGDIYPHILLRDYARNTIEYILYSNIPLSKIHISKIRPPYKSHFPLFLPSNRFIDLITEKHDFIKSSMATEYGRGCGWYGDFGRYVFQSALENWNVNYDKLSNWCIWKIYTKYKYGKWFFEFDKRIGSGRARGTYPNERIGKKYQWLMFYEALARTSDNKKRAEKYSDILEKYNGPWMPYVRDIDPSILIRNTYDYDKYSEKFWWKKVPYSNWDIPNWEKSRFDLPELIPIIEQKDSNLIDWILLDADLFWEENKSNIYNSKSIWYRIKAYFMKNENFETARNYLCSQNFYNDRLMNTRQLYQVFSREYFWSAAYKDFNSSYYEHQEYDNFITPDSKDLGIYYPSCDDFLWEEEFDSSKEEAISFKKPSSFLFNKMKMRYSRKEGEFLSEKGELICFDPSVNNPMKSALFIKQEELYSFLKKTGFSIFWVVIGEKNSPGNIEDLSGFYYLDNNKLVGEIK